MKKQRHLVKSGKNVKYGEQWKHITQCISESPLTRCKRVHETNDSILEYVSGAIEFRWTHEESGEVRFLLAFFLQRALLSYVTNEQQFVDSVSKGLMGSNHWVTRDSSP